MSCRCVYLYRNGDDWQIQSPHDQYSLTGSSVINYNAFKITHPINIVTNAKSQVTINYYNILEYLDYIMVAYGVGIGFNYYETFAGYILIEETKAPDGYKLEKNPIKEVDLKTTNSITFVNQKIEEESEPEIVVPNTGAPKEEVNATNVTLSIIGVLLGALFIAILPKLHHKKITFKK